jgi:hypothetical protein
MTLRSVILHNFWLKAFSVVLATVIWFFIHDGIRHDAAARLQTLDHALPQGYIRVPVTIQTEPGDKRVFRWEPTEVIVIAQGEEAVLRRAARRDIKVYLNLINFHSTQAVTEQLQVQAPADINVIDISPSVATVRQVSADGK